MGNHIRQGTRVIFEGKHSFETGTLHRYGGESSSGGSGASLYRSFTEKVYVLPDGADFPIDLPYKSVRKDTPRNRKIMAERLAIIHANQDRIRRENSRS